MRYSLGREPWWNADKRARSVERAPHRKMRRWLPCVCRRSASFIFFFLRSPDGAQRNPGRRCKRRCRSRIALRSIQATKPGTENRKACTTPALSLHRTGFAFDVTIFSQRAIHFQSRTEKLARRDAPRERERLAMRIQRSWRRELPLPGGERVGVRGFGSRSFTPTSELPHPNPLPSGEREFA